MQSLDKDQANVQEYTCNTPMAATTLPVQDIKDSHTTTNRCTYCAVTAPSLVHGEQMTGVLINVGSGIAHDAKGTDTER